MADAAQEFGLSRAWRATVNNVGEREVVLALAIFLPLGALLLGYCGGRRRLHVSSRTLGASSPVKITSTAQYRTPENEQ